MGTSDTWFLKQWVTGTLAAFQCVTPAELPQPRRSRQAPCSHQHVQAWGLVAPALYKHESSCDPSSKVTCLHFKQGLQCSDPRQ